MKVKESRYIDAGLSGGYWEYRVRALSPGEEVPAGAISLPAETQEYDWTPEHRLPEGA